MASKLASLLSFTLTTSLLLLPNFSPSHSFKLTFKSSAVSSYAAVSPALSPDAMPLLPTPGGTVAPPESSIPTIPSSLSPPNPDSLVPSSSSLSPSELPAAAAESSALVLKLGFHGLTRLFFLSLFILSFF